MKIFDYESEIESLKQDAEIIEKEHKQELEKLKEELSKASIAPPPVQSPSSSVLSPPVVSMTPPPSASPRMHRKQPSTIVSSGNKDTDEKIALLQSQIASQFESMDQAEAKHQDEIKGLKDNIELWKEKYNKCQLKIEEVERELSEVKESSMEFETKFEFESEKNENLQKEIEELKIKADSKASKEEVYKKGMEDLEDKIYELNSKLSEEKNNRRQAIKEKIQIEEDINTYKCKIEEMNQDIEDARFDNGVLLKKSVQMIKDLQNELKKLNKSIEKLRIDHKKEIERIRKEVNSNIGGNEQDNSPKRDKKRFGRDNNNNDNNDSAIVEKLNQITQENCDYKMKIESMSSIIDKLKEQINSSSGVRNDNSVGYTFAAGDAITEGLQQKINELHEEIAKLKKNNNKLSRDIEKYKMKSAVSLDKESKEVLKKFESQLKDNQKLKDKLDEIFEKSKIFKDRCDMLAQENLYLFFSIEFFKYLYFLI